MDSHPIFLCLVQFQPFGSEAYLILAIIVLLLAFSAFNSAAETGFFSLSPVDIKEIKDDEDNPLNQTILRLLKQPERLLATVLLSNDMANIAFAVLSALLMSMTIDFGDSAVLQFVIETVVITFIILLFAEIMPKLYASQNPLKVVKLVARPLSFFDRLLSPFSTLLVKSTSFVNKRMVGKQQSISVDELGQALELTGGDIEEEEMLRGIVEFGNLTVDSIMTPRLDVVAIEIRENFTQVIDRIIETGYSRIPVYEKSLDQIKGILYIKDLIAHLNKNEAFRWQTLIRPATFAPETRKIDDMLLDFQKNKVHMAIVVDEFGGTLGIITMEDIMEEIIGEISDEYDDDDEMYYKLSDNVYEFEGRVQLTDFFKLLEISPDEFGDLTDEVDTLAGLILEMFGEIPHVSEYVSHGRYTFTVVAMDKRRIKRIKLEIDDEWENEPQAHNQNRNRL